MKLRNKTLPNSYNFLSQFRVIFVVITWIKFTRASLIVNYTRSYRLESNYFNALPKHYGRLFILEKSQSHKKLKFYSYIISGTFKKLKSVFLLVYDIQLHFKNRITLMWKLYLNEYPFCGLRYFWASSWNEAFVHLSKMAMNQINASFILPKQTKALSKGISLF